jgi:hypothetical protein
VHAVTGIPFLGIYRPAYLIPNWLFHSFLGHACPFLLSPNSLVKMTVNHLFLMVSHVKMPAMSAFYRSVLTPLGYSEMITVSESYIGFGSDYPYFWLKALPEGKDSVPTHIALDAPGK